MIQKVGLAFRVRDAAGTSAALKARCQKIIDYHQSPDAAHTSCGRAYASLCATDSVKADQLWNDAVDFLDSISPPRRRPRGPR